MRPSFYLGTYLVYPQKTIHSMLAYSIVSLLGIALLGKRLLFTSLEPELAQAKGISLRMLSILFFMLVSIAITEASQVVGILLVFTLLVGPPASALCCTRRFWKGLGLSVLIGVVMVWLGIMLAYVTDWPVSFWISALCFSVYLGFKNLPRL